MKATDVGEFFEELDAGVFAQKIGHELSQVAASVVNHQRAGQIQITLDVKQIGSGHQVAVTHKLRSTRPTKRGKVTEEDETQTPMHVGTGGAMSFFPENQMQLPTMTKEDMRSERTREN